MLDTSGFEIFYLYLGKNDQSIKKNVQKMFFLTITDVRMSDDTFRRKRK